MRKFGRVNCLILEKLIFETEIMFVLYQEFWHVTGKFRESIQHEKYSLLILVYACEISARLESYIIIYEEFSPNCPVL